MDVRRTKVFVFAFLFLTILTSFGEGYSGIIPADPCVEPCADPCNCGKCMYRGEYIKPGVSAGPLTCQRLTCNEDGSVLVEGCGRIRLQNCNRGERFNLDKPYPECCKQRFKCRRPDGSSYYEEMGKL